MLNLSINNTLSRTFLTTLTTMLVTICLLVFGGGVIFDFAIVMFFGLISGTFSSICIAPAVLLKWHRRAAQDAILDKAKKA
jgi:preprotein translocase subunit SecF